jgi:hypothetical protein
LGLRREHVETAAAFHRKLDHHRRPAHTGYFCFAGSREETAAHVRLRLKSDGVSLRPDKALLQSGGDGTVPNWSSTLPQTRQLYVPGDHGVIYKGSLLQKHLVLLLGQRGDLDRGTPTELFVDPPAADPGQQIRVRLIFPERVTEFHGELIVHKMTLDGDGKGKLPFSLVHREPIRYAGPEVDSFLLRMPAPAERGHYRIAYLDGETSEESAERELIVQA